MKGAFVQVEAVVQQNFPGTEVLGTQYPVAPIKARLFTAELPLEALL